ncbi:hypothetical protein D3C86_1258390 [compost metagenome]
MDRFLIIGEMLTQITIYVGKSQEMRISQMFRLYPLSLALPQALINSIPRQIC